MGFRAPRELGAGAVRLPDDQRDAFLEKALPTTGEVLSASFDLSAEETSLNSIERMVELSSLDQGQERLPPEELNKRFPGMPVPFTEAKPLSVAQEIFDRHKRRMELSQVIANAQETPLVYAGTFASSLVPHMIDPINLAADFTVGGAIISLGRGVTGARVVLQSSNAGRLARGAAEGVLGNLATEPLTIAANELDLQDYTVAQAFTNIVAGGVFFPAARFGLSKVAALVGRYGPDHVEAFGKAAIGQVAAGRRVDLDPMVRDLSRELGGAPRWAQEYSFRPLGPDLRGTPLYVSGKGNIPTIRDSVLFEEDFGDGVYITDHPGVANGAASRKLDQQGGGVLEVELGDVKLLDLDGTINPEVRKAIEPILRDVLGKKYDFEAKTGKGLFDDVRRALESGKGNDETIPRINQALQEAGFDGYRYEGGKSGAADPHNAILMFNPDKVTERQRIAPDLSAVRSAPRNELQETLDRNQDFRSDLPYDDQAFKEFKDSTAGEFSPIVDTNTISKGADEALEELDGLRNQELLSPAEIKELEDIKGMKKQAEAQDRLIAAATYCVRLGRG